MSETSPPDDLDVRRRRALWRATHRGTKELDILIGTYAAERLAGMDAAELTRFEQFLSEQETELQALLLAPEAAQNVPFADLVNAVRAFHGMPSA
jgi:antitoxin CptB